MQRVEDNIWGGCSKLFGQIIARINLDHVIACIAQALHAFTARNETYLAFSRRAALEDGNSLCFSHSARARCVIFNRDTSVMPCAAKIFT